MTYNIEPDGTRFTTAMDARLIEIVGAGQAPLRRIRERHLRAELAGLAADEGGAAELRLRAYLAAGRTPPAELLAEGTISRALNPKDCASLMPFLVRKSLRLQADAPLGAISKWFHRTPPRDQVTICSRLAVAIKGWAAKGASLDDPSLLQFLSLTESLATWHHVKGRADRRKGRHEPKCIAPLVTTGIRWTAEALNSATAQASLRMLASMIREQRSDIDRWTEEDPDFAKALGQIVDFGIRQLEVAASDGDAASMQEWAGCLMAGQPASERARSKVEELYADRARFEDAVQRALADLLGMSVEDSAKAGPVCRDATGGVQATQLAASLLAAWDASREGPKAKDAFETLSFVLGTFFALRIRGRVGEVEDYSPRLHDLDRGGKVGTRVRIVRPGVESTQGPTSKILLKAVVVPAQGGNAR